MVESNNPFIQTIKQGATLGEVLKGRSQPLRDLESFLDKLLEYHLMRTAGITK